MRGHGNQFCLTKQVCQISRFFDQQYSTPIKISSYFSSTTTLPPQTDRTRRNILQEKQRIIVCCFSKTTMPSAGDGKSRPLIGAMFRGPGPCYGLPETIGYQKHDCRKSKAPAFTFGFKGKYKDKDECSPGPAYFIPEKLTRNGSDGAPKYSLKGRPNIQTSFRTPGPDAYRAELVPPLKEKRAAAYSFGSRTKYSQKDNHPAPNQYSLPNLISSKVPNKTTMPSFSMTGRSKIGGFHEDLQKTPGPGTYKVINPRIYKQKHPEFSMGGRFVPPGDSTQKPGPGAHSPEKVYVNRKGAPQFSFGIRHSEYTAPIIFALD